jgi:hypothetical protein
LSQLKKQKLEAAGSSGAVQALRTGNDAPVVGPDAPTANSKMFKLDIATADVKSANFRFARHAGIVRPKKLFEGTNAKLDVVLSIGR